MKNVVIPRKGKPSEARRAEEHRKAFPRTVKWRTGCEGRISCLKRGYGWDRSRIDGTEGARIWTGHGVLAHNLVKISAQADENPAPTTRHTPAPNTSTRASDLLRLFQVEVTNHINLIRHTRPGESRRRTGENHPRIAQVDSALRRVIACLDAG